MKQNGKGKFQKRNRTIVFLGGCEELLFSVKMSFLENRQTLFVFKRQKTRIFRCNYLFLENVFCGHSK